MNVLTAIALSLAAGFAVPLQAGTNARLGTLLGHPLWATTVSLLVSLIAVFAVILIFKVEKPNTTALQSAPWWAWLGGVAGVFYITIALLMAPRLGTLNFMMAVIVGQLVISLLIDYFGLVGLPRRPVNIQKLFGVFVVIIGFLITTRS
ncbi:DMT family transporter [Pseudomonas capsici]|uniref:DMT family transporter n=1 Tax=Pseudomonas capsici TaxID=2810614 RepID=UPI001910A7EC|nr:MULTISPECIES: DMT family transporter [Pseudomonas]MCV4265919.1 DMT family transporter [Pseudomonas capsici]MCV4275393.1 DMT family transporter [Pseudomonas capsici]GFM53452.1 hypothetical protein PSCICE_47190 [Pseudomonas cichorii]